MYARHVIKGIVFKQIEALNAAVTMTRWLPEDRYSYSSDTHDVHDLTVKLFTIKYSTVTTSVVSEFLCLINSDINSYLSNYSCVILCYVCKFLIWCHIIRYLSPWISYYYRIASYMGRLYKACPIVWSTDLACLGNFNATHKPRDS